MNDLNALVRGAAGSKMWRVRATAGVDGRVSGLLPIRSGPSAAWLRCSSTSKSSGAGPLLGGNRPRRSQRLLASLPNAPTASRCVAMTAQPRC
jgi:hypothetical protein